MGASDGASHGTTTCRCPSSTGTLPVFYCVLYGHSCCAVLSYVARSLFGCRLVAAPDWVGFCAATQQSYKPFEKVLGRGHLCIRSALFRDNWKTFQTSQICIPKARAVSAYVGRCFVTNFKGGQWALPMAEMAGCAPACL